MNLGGLTSISSSTSISATTVNLGSATSIASSTVVTATDVTLSGLTATSAGSTVTLVGPTSVSAPALATLGGDIIAANATTFAAEALSTSTGTIDIAAGATVHLKIYQPLPQPSLDIATVVNLKLVEQSTTVDFSHAAHLVTLDYTGKLVTPAVKTDKLML